MRARENGIQTYIEDKISLGHCSARPAEVDMVGIRMFFFYVRAH